MKKRKTKYLLGSLTNSEREYFLRWLKAELHDKQLYIQHLAEILSRRGAEEVEDEEIWQQLYPERTFDDARLRKLMSDLQPGYMNFWRFRHFGRIKLHGISTF